MVLRLQDQIVGEAGDGCGKGFNSMSLIDGATNPKHYQMLVWLVPGSFCQVMSASKIL